MLYRENGQFKASYRADQQIFPILQDRAFMFGLFALALVAVPLFGSEYLFRAIVMPWLILSLAAIGLNLLVGYFGQISLRARRMMAVSAYAAYKIFVSMPPLNLLVVLILIRPVDASLGIVLCTSNPSRQ